MKRQYPTKVCKMTLPNDHGQRNTDWMVAMMQVVEDAVYELTQHRALLYMKTDQTIVATAFLTSQNEIHAESPFQHCHIRRPTAKLGDK